MVKVFQSELSQRIYRFGVNALGLARPARARSSRRAARRRDAGGLPDLGSGLDLLRLQRDPAQHHRHARARPAARLGRRLAAAVDLQRGGRPAAPFSRLRNRSRRSEEWRHDAHVLRVEQFERGWIDAELLPAAAAQGRSWPADGTGGDRDLPPLPAAQLPDPTGLLARGAAAGRPARAGGLRERVHRRGDAGRASKTKCASLMAWTTRRSWCGPSGRRRRAGRGRFSRAGDQRAASRRTAPRWARRSIPRRRWPTWRRFNEARGSIDGLHIAIVPGDGASLVIVQSLAMLLGRTSAATCS